MVSTHFYTSVTLPSTGFTAQKLLLLEDQFYNQVIEATEVENFSKSPKLALFDHLDKLLFCKLSSNSMAHQQKQYIKLLLSKL